MAVVVEVQDGVVVVAGVAVEVAAGVAAVKAAAGVVVVGGEVVAMAAVVEVDEAEVVVVVVAGIKRLLFFLRDILHGISHTRVCARSTCVGELYARDGPSFSSISARHAIVDLLVAVAHNTRLTKFFSWQDGAPYVNSTLLLMKVAIPPPHENHPQQTERSELDVF